jgi:hypothetical protein
LASTLKPLPPTGRIAASISPIRPRWNREFARCAAVFDRRWPGASTRLRLLAALDEALDRILTARERQLLATLPSLLERRFQQLLAAHQRALLDSGQADEPLLWMQPGGWLAIFCEELQAMLIAELDLRLQPTLGLIEALHNEADRH